MALRKPGELFNKDGEPEKESSTDVSENIDEIKQEFTQYSWNHNKIEELRRQVDNVSSSLNYGLSEVVDKNLNFLNNEYTKLIEKFNDKIKTLDEQFTSKVDELKKSHVSLNTEVTIIEKRQKNLKLVEGAKINVLKEEVLSELEGILSGNVTENFKKLEEKVDTITKTQIQNLTESYNEPPDVKNSDVLTPLNKKFVNLDEFQEHYRVFLNRIQRQLSSLGGGGAVLITDLDDVERSTAQVNGKYLRYNSTKGKWEGADASGGGGGGGISNVVEDTSPQLGGNLDLNNKNITGTGNISITGNANLSTLNVSGVSTFNEARFANDKRLKFGDDIDLQIYHFNATNNNFISAANNSDLTISAREVELMNQNHSSYYFKGAETGSIVYHNNSQRIATTNTGVVITGICTATSFRGDGSALTGIVGSGSGVVIQHDGSNVGTAGTINFSTNLDVSAISSGIVTVTASGGGGGGISNVVEDTSPQLGGDLDVNGKDIVSTSNGNIELSPNGTGAVVFKGVSGNGGNGAGRFKLNCEVNSHGITIQGPPHSAGANYTLTLPNTDGNADQVLKTNGSGVLDWVDQSSGVTSQSTTFTGSAGTAQVIETYAVGSADCTEFTFHVTSGTNIQAQKLLVMDNGSAVHFNQYAVMYSGSKLIDFSADLSGGNVRIKATPETGVSGSITIKSIKQVI